ncbi:MAG: hypothetical protein V4515_04625 [Chloroflexota bacterium]
MTERSGPRARQARRDGAAAAELAEVAEPEGGPRKGQRQAMLRAVNRDLRAMPADVSGSALAELARQLARRFDQGDDRATAQLRAVLGDLQRLTRGSTAPRPAPDEPAAGPVGDDQGPEAAERGANGGGSLEAVRKNRAIRRANAPGRGANRPSDTPDMDGAE